MSQTLPELFILLKLQQVAYVEYEEKHERGNENFVLHFNDSRAESYRDMVRQQCKHPYG